MEFVILILALLNHNDDTAAVKAIPVANHQECENLKSQIIDSMGPLPPNVEIRGRCLSTELLVPSV